MKAKIKLSMLVLITFVVLSACTTGRQATAQSYDDDSYYNDDGYRNNRYDDNNAGPDVDMNVFVNALNPYGRWVSSPTYGRAWICNEPGFTPYYTRGHWVYTSFGWTWASDYQWGWAPFHYGRWAQDPFYGWMWVPGYEWGPAWVGWRTGGDYYGWAPLAPGIHINAGFSFGNSMPADRWCFVPRRHITNPHFSHYRADRGKNITIINNTTVINNTNIYHNTRYVAGPGRSEVEKYTGRKINTVTIANDTKPGNYRVDKNTIKMYRPQIKNDDKTVIERNSAGNNNKIKPSQEASPRLLPAKAPKDIQKYDRDNNSRDIKPGRVWDNNSREDDTRPKLKDNREEIDNNNRKENALADKNKESERREDILKRNEQNRDEDSRWQNTNRNDNIQQKQPGGGTPQPDKIRKYEDRKSKVSKDQFEYPVNTNNSKMNSQNPAGRKTVPAPQRNMQQQKVPSTQQQPPQTKQEKDKK